MGTHIPRPRVRPPTTNADALLLLVTFAGLAFVAVTLVLRWGALPATVTTHYGLDGHPDAYGSKDVFLLFPVLGFALVGLLGLLQRVPWVYNYPVRITPENALRQYALAVRLLRVLQAELAWLFAVLLWVVVASAANGGIFDPLPVLLFVGGLLGTIAVYLVVAVRRG